MDSAIHLCSGQDELLLFLTCGDQCEVGCEEAAKAARRCPNGAFKMRKKKKKKAIICGPLMQFYHWPLRCGEVTRAIKSSIDHIRSQEGKASKVPGVNLSTVKQAFIQSALEVFEVSFAIDGSTVPRGM